MISERRNSKRITLSSPMRYQRKGSQRYGNSVGRDISNDGIGFVSNEFLPVTTQLIFEIQHPERDAFIKALGEIVWISSQPYSERFSVGARFTKPLEHF